ncbi:MAG: 4Fe-4S binding protein [Atribacterota bacterium]|nr:4Fe-4S binding protein [Atribacterota bacterium]
MAKKQKRHFIRLAVQIFFLALIILISVNSYRSEQGLAPLLIGNPSLHAVCPFGGVVTVYNYFTEGAFIQKIHQSAYTLMWLVLALTLLFGPVFCGWICPFGTVEEFIGKIGKKIFKKRYNHFIPSIIDKPLRYVRYVILILVVVNTAISAKLLFSNFDPYFALFNIWSSEVTRLSLLILGLILIGSLFVERPWCKYLCPLGALLGIFNLFRIVRLKRNEKTCINCKACDRICPMNINISASKVIFDQQCISCLLCTDEIACPVSNTLNFSVLERKNFKEGPNKNFKGKIKESIPGGEK